MVRLLLVLSLALPLACEADPIDPQEPDCWWPVWSISPCLDVLEVARETVECDRFAEDDEVKCLTVLAALRGVDRDLVIDAFYGDPDAEAQCEALEELQEPSTCSIYAGTIDREECLDLDEVRTLGATGVSYPAGIVCSALTDPGCRWPEEPGSLFTCE